MSLGRRQKEYHSNVVGDRPFRHATRADMRVKKHFPDRCLRACIKY